MCESLLLKYYNETEIQLFKQKLISFIHLKTQPLPRSKHTPSRL